MPLTTIPEIGTRVVVTGKSSPFAGKSGEVFSYFYDPPSVRVLWDGPFKHDIIPLADLDLALPRAA